MVKGDVLRVDEAGLVQQAKPVGSTEQAVFVPIVNRTSRLAASVQQVGELGGIDVVARVGVEGPLQPAHAAVGGVVASTFSPFGERFAQAVGRKQRHAA